MRPTGNHVHTAVLKAVIAITGADGLDRQKPVMIVEETSSDDWASVTFTGATHRIALRFDGPAGLVASACARLVRELPDHEIPLAGQIVADIAIVLSNESFCGANMVSQSLTVNLLTILD